MRVWWAAVQNEVAGWGVILNGDEHSELRDVENARARALLATGAAILLPLFEANPRRWGAVVNLNAGWRATSAETSAGDALRDCLRRWKSHCADPEHVALVDAIAAQFQIQL